MSGLKLYYSPGACSLASHLALEEVGAAFEAVLVSTAKGEQRTPEYLAINPKGRVPALADGDFVLTENPAILRYIARKFPNAGLWPDDPRDEARCAEWLAWISSTVHPTYSHIRRPERYATGEDAKADVIETGKVNVRRLWPEVDRKLAAGAGPFALGSRLSVADLYLLVFWVWARAPMLGFEVERDLPAWTAHARRLGERDGVRRAFEREGLPLP
jgi:glutathione S-transferase